MTAALPGFSEPQPIYLNRSASLLHGLNRSLEQVQLLVPSIPPSGLVLLSCFAVQFGVATAKSLFETIGAIGTGFLCNAIATLFLLAAERRQLRSLSRNPRDYGSILLLGIAIAGMTLAIYSAVNRIPMGLASTLEFVGPLAVALLGSRRLLDLLWVGLAATGILLLTPVSGGAMDLTGVLLALLSGGFWACYILLSVPAGRIFPKGAGLALAMTVASVILAVPGIAQAGTALLHPVVLLLAILAAFLGKFLPYSLEYTALKRMPPRVFGVLMSIEPAIAALVGLAVLHEQLNLQSLTAIVLVIVAAMGATLLGRQN
jgi:inner membrane transporter RhtA